MCEHRDKSSFWEGLAAGVILGVAAYVFLATEDGKKITSSLRRKAEPYLDELDKALEDWKDQSAHILQKAEEVKETLSERFEEAKEDLTPTLTAKLEGPLSHIEKLQERGREATVSIRKRFFKHIKKPVN